MIVSDCTGSRLRNFHSSSFRPPLHFNSQDLSSAKSHFDYNNKILIPLDFEFCPDDALFLCSSFFIDQTTMPLFRRGRFTYAGHKMFQLDGTTLEGNFITLINQNLCEEHPLLRQFRFFMAPASCQHFPLKQPKHSLSYLTARIPSTTF